MPQKVEHPGYEWGVAGAVHSHDYLLPVVLRIVDASFGTARATIIDVGCGNGYVDSVLAGRGHAVVGLDVSLQGIERARASFPSVHFEVGSVYDREWPAPPGSADCVVSLEVVEHLFDPKAFFTRSLEALRPGGLLVVSTPYHGYLKNLATSLVDGWDRHFGVAWQGGHIKFFSKRTLRLMAEEAGFHELRVHGVGRLPGLWKSMILAGRK